MTDPDCSVCRGRGSITLPLFHPLSAISLELDAPPTLQVAAKDFPCPECEEKITIRQVRAFSNFTWYPEALGHDNTEHMRHIETNVAHAIVDRIMAAGFFKFTYITDRVTGKLGLVAEIGLVEPSRLDTLDKRIAENQERLAVRIKDKAIALIQNWGSYYGYASISKDQAYREIEHAYKTVLEEDKNAPARDAEESRWAG